MTNLSEFARIIHAHNVNVGWWDNDPCIYEKMQLISTEIAEATEGERKDLMDDKLPHRKMGEVELADALIRTLDLGERLGLEIDGPELCAGEASIQEYHERGYGVAVLHLVLNAILINWWHNMKPADHISRARYSALVGAILHTATVLDYDILTAAREKHEFNLTRADHKRENRAAPGGKAF